MKVLISAEHPAHVHLFKNLAWQLMKTEDEVLFICVDREFVIQLLDSYGFSYKVLGMHYKSMLGKVYGMMKYDFLTYRIIRQYKPDILLSHGSIYTAHASFFARKPNISLHDTFAMEQVRLSMPFTDVALTGDYSHPSLGNKDISYPGYHELAYLHPNVFTPDGEVLTRMGVSKGEKYAIVRFVAWNATHDVGHKGLSLENKIKLIESLSMELKVFISSEDHLPKELQKHQIKIDPDMIHSALCYAHLFVGESGTMASEAAVLGTPAIFMNKNRFGCIDNQISYGILYQYGESEADQQRVINHSVELAKHQDKHHYQEKSKRMLLDKIDVTSFLYWFIKTYPSSKHEMLNNPLFEFEKFK